MGQMAAMGWLMWCIHSLPLELPLSCHLFQYRMLNSWLLAVVVVVAADVAAQVVRVDI
jgi:hypothetical protein